MTDAMSATSLRIVFRGAALNEATMDVRDLAPALLAVGALFEESSRELNGDGAKISVHVKADFTSGSFDVGLDLMQSLVGQVQSWLTGPGGSSAANLLTIVIGVSTVSALMGKSLFWLIKKARGRKPTSMTKLDSGNIILCFGEESCQISDDVFQLYRNISVRKAASDMVKPLEKEGIDGIDFLTGEGDKKSIVSIDKSESYAFQAPSDEDEPILIDTRRTAMSIISLTFKDGNKWQLYDGQNAIYAIIDDKDFLDKVNNGDISFSKNDILICEVVAKQWRSTGSGGTLKTEYTIVKVIDHKRTAKQLAFKFLE